MENVESVTLVERVAAIDVGKAELTCCVRTPSDTTAGRRSQQVRTYAPTTAALLELSDWLRCERVTLVVMEATSDYWKPPYYVLEDHVECWVVNAAQVKHLPGRPKTDRLDAAWLAKVAERGMCRPSFIPPKPIRRLRDLTRYRRSLTRERTREKQRVEKLLEDAQIKLSTVASDIFGVSGRQMLEAMIAGERDPKILAQMARTTMRRKITLLREALSGHFDDHHAFLCRMMLDRVDDLSARIEQLTGQIEQAIAPFASQVDQLDEVTGIGRVTAQELIAELGVTMTAFPTSQHLVSWARFCPRAKHSAGKKTNGGTGRGNPWLAATLGEIVIAASRTRTFPGERYRRLARRRGTKRALVAVGNTMLTIVWHLLSDPTARYHDLGPDFHQTHTHQARQTRNLIRQLEHLTGQKVALQPAA
jgi:transposase